MTRVEYAMAIGWRSNDPRAGAALEEIRAFDKKLGSKTAFFYFELDAPSLGSLLAAGLIFHKAETGHVRLTERGRTWADMP